MTDQSTPKRRLPWGKIVLVTSLALNLLIIGTVAGAFLGKRGDSHPKGLRDLGLGPFAEALPRADRRAIADALRGQNDRFRKNRTEMRAHFEAFLEALRADEFERETFEALITEQRERVSERQALGQRILLDQIAAMSVEERRTFADNLANKLRHRGERRR